MPFGKILRGKNIMLLLQQPKPNQFSWKKCLPDFLLHPLESVKSGGARLLKRIH